MARGPSAARPGRRRRGRLIAFLVLVAVQLACAAIFMLDILMSVVGFYPVPLAWSTREMMEMGAAIGLMLGLLFGALLIRRSLTELKRAEERIDRAAGAFRDLLDARFSEWGLTAAERDVALFAIKGMSLGEIARLRATSEGTVKAQTGAIYRKAGVTGRPQLLALFIDDLLAGPTPSPEAQRAA